VSRARGTVAPDDLREVVGGISPSRAHKSFCLVFERWSTNEGKAAPSGTRMARPSSQGSLRRCRSSLFSERK
jgi:hypothetical protein